MTKTSFRKIFFFALLNCVHVAQGSSIVNERLPITGEELEKHWHLDCRKTAETILSQLYATNGEKKVSTSLISNEVRHLGYCGYIYNIRDNNRYETCPDYLGAFELLNLQLRSHRSISTSIKLRVTELLANCRTVSND